MRTPIGLSALCALLLSASALLYADKPDDSLANKKAADLYNTYETLNTPANLGVMFVGGKPPRFIEQQIRILVALGNQKTPDARRNTIKIFDEYMERIDKLGANGFRTSPLQALQIQMVAFLAAKVDHPDVRTRLKTLAESTVIKEYARSRAVVVLVALDVQALNDAQDPDGSKRGKILLDGILANMTFEQSTHAPARLYGVARLAWDIGKHKPILVWEVLSQADTLPKRYARDLAFASACSKVIKAKEPVTVADGIRLREIAERWIKEYRPLLAKQSYPSDVVGRVLRYLAKQKGNEKLAQLMPPEDPKPKPPKP